MAPRPKRRLTLGKDKVIGGVCAGLASYYDMDPTAVRLLWAILTVFTIVFPGVLLYVICWIIMPRAR